MTFGLELGLAETCQRACLSFASQSLASARLTAVSLDGVTIGGLLNPSRRKNLKASDCACPPGVESRHHDRDARETAR